MLVTYDPATQGQTLSDEELRQLKELKTDCTSFSEDEPELTDALIQKMKASKKMTAVL